MSLTVRSDPWRPKLSTAAFGCSRHSEVGHGLSLERGHHAFGHRHRHELVRLPDAFVGRPNDPLSHLRLGRRRAGRHRDAIRRSVQSPAHGGHEVGCEGCGDLRHLRGPLGCLRRVVDRVTRRCRANQLKLRRA